jgi:thiamine-monophosphate kinase
MAPTGPLAAGAQASEPVTVAEIGERALIERIRARVPRPPASVVVGIGDDAAVVEPERNALEVITTDGLVEGVHFDRTFMGPADIGHKALAVNLSDLAAMGASPRLAVLSLLLPPTWPVAGADALVDGLLALAARFRVALVGGNISRSPGPLVVDITATGAVHRRRVLTRGGARRGDELYVTGSVGGAAAGLGMLRGAAAAGQGAEVQSAGTGQAECIRCYLRPEPRVRVGVLLGRNRAARACIDLSDGLADGVRQIARASGLGAVIEADAIPIGPAARRWFEDCGVSPIEAALTGGEDYELLFAVPPRGHSRLRAVQRLVKDVVVTRIGRLTADPALVVNRSGQLASLPDGFTHFG